MSRKAPNYEWYVTEKKKIISRHRFWLTAFLCRMLDGNAFPYSQVESRDDYIRRIEPRFVAREPGPSVRKTNGGGPKEAA